MYRKNEGSLLLCKPSNRRHLRASASKITPVASTKAVAEAANLESTLSGIDKMLLNMAAEETTAATEKAMATVSGKGKKIADTTSKEMDFDLRNLVGQELSEAEKRSYKNMVYPVATSRSHAHWWNR
jgi:hypothetical protein